MNFGISLPSGKPCDAVPLALNAVDHLIVLPGYRQFYAQVAFVSHDTLAGGQCATAMVALARLGMRARYIGKVGDDADGKFQLQTLADDGVEASGVKVVQGAPSQTSFIVVDEQSGERTIIWKLDE